MSCSPRGRPAGKHLSFSKQRSFAECILIAAEGPADSTQDDNLLQTSTALYEDILAFVRVQYRRQLLFLLGWNGDRLFRRRGFGRGQLALELGDALL
jgi:hypothetical protein